MGGLTASSRRTRAVRATPQPRPRVQAVYVPVRPPAVYVIKKKTVVKEIPEKKPAETPEKKLEADTAKPKPAKPVDDDDDPDAIWVLPPTEKEKADQKKVKRKKPLKKNNTKSKPRSARFRRTPNSRK
eukprot:jgi/Mesvir1/7789/Mv11732-RA.1